MSVALTVSRSGDVAVISGVDTDAALTVLCHSVMTGAAFDAYPALLVDLRQVPALSPAVRSALDQASRAAMRRHQWLGTVPAGQRPAAAVVRARQGLRLVYGHRSTAARPVRDLLATVREIVASTVAAVVRR